MPKINQNSDNTATKMRRVFRALNKGKDVKKAKKDIKKTVRFPTMQEFKEEEDNIAWDVKEAYLMSFEEERLYVQKEAKEAAEAEARAVVEAEAMSNAWVKAEAKAQSCSCDNCRNWLMDLESLDELWGRMGVSYGGGYFPNDPHPWFACLL